MIPLDREEVSSAETVERLVEFQVSSSSISSIQYPGIYRLSPVHKAQEFLLSFFFFSLAKVGCSTETAEQTGSTEISRKRCVGQITLFVFDGSLRSTKSGDGFQQGELKKKN